MPKKDPGTFPRAVYAGPCTEKVEVEAPAWPLRLYQCPPAARTRRRSADRGTHAATRGSSERAGHPRPRGAQWLPDVPTSPPRHTAYSDPGPGELPERQSTTTPSVINVMPTTSCRCMPWPLRKGTSRRTTSQRFGLNPMTAAPAKIATTAKTLRDTYAGYAAVTSEGGRQRSSCRMVLGQGKTGIGGCHVGLDCHRRRLGCLLLVCVGDEVTVP